MTSGLKSNESSIARKRWRITSFVVPSFVEPIARCEGIPSGPGRNGILSGVGVVGLFAADEQLNAVPLTLQFVMVLAHNGLRASTHVATGDLDDFQFWDSIPNQRLTSGAVL